MARIRTIKPEFWKHEDLSELPEATHMLAAALLNHADDEGYFNANPALVRSECLPLREPSVSIQTSLESLASIGYIALGKGDDGKRYGRVLKFDDHQRVNRPTPSKIKAIGIVWEDSPQAHPQISEASSPERKGKEQGREEEQGREGRSSLRSESPGATPPGQLVLSSAPVNLGQHKAERIAQVTDEAIATYNASTLVKANGGNLPAVSPKVGRENRQKQVQRCIRTARAICEESYGGTVIVRQFWVDYWTECAKDDFFAGRLRGGKGHENWTPDFEFLTKAETMLKVYDRAASEDAA